MKYLAETINQVVSKARPELLTISSEDASIKVSPTIWSKKEILGHLIDSALNNLQRFIRAGYGAAADFPAYDQNKWVELQCYNQMEWMDLIALFAQLNFHICRVLIFLPEDVVNSKINVGKVYPASFRFVANDYLQHLQHHLEVILDHDL